MTLMKKPHSLDSLSLSLETEGHDGHEGVQTHGAVGDSTITLNQA